MRVEILQLPTALPATLDPQVRNYFQGYTTNLQYFCDQVEKRVNHELLVYRDVRIGGSVASGATSLAVGFDVPLQGIDYGVIAMPSWPTTIAATGKTANGFQLQFGAGAPAGATVDIIVFLGVNA